MPLLSAPQDNLWERPLSNQPTGAVYGIYLTSLFSGGGGLGREGALSLWSRSVGLHCVASSRRDLDTGGGFRAPHPLQLG